MRSFCAGTRLLDVLGGEVDIVFGDWAAALELGSPAGKFVGSRGGAIAG